MALTSTLGSPGIEIREVDNSFRLDSSTATTVFIPGFASQGPVDEVMSISSMGDFETIYGVPTNAAERYFYYTVKAILDGSGTGVTVLCSRLPYGSGKGDIISNAYTMLAYPAVPVIKKKHYKQYSCCEEFSDSGTQSYKVSFNIDKDTVTYKAAKTAPTTWTELAKDSSNKNSYEFATLDNNRGYSLTNTSTKEVVYVYNDYVTYDFDKFIFDSAAEESLAT